MEANIIKIAYEAVFEPFPLFFDRRSTIINNLWKTEFIDWEVDAFSAFLVNKTSYESSIIEHQRINFIKEKVGKLSDNSYPNSKFLTIFNSYCKETNRNTINRLGMRTMAYTVPGYTFKELADKLTPKLYPNDAKLFQITAKKFDDVSLASVYQREDFSVRLQLGPVIKDELILRSQMRYRSEDIPDVALYYDIDCFINTLPLTNTEAKLNKFKKITAETITEMNKYLFGK
jgi:hypothetical protein